ncbi:hypothetical protein HK097_011178 [Rhizophlyctis rosea]|uniref:Lytic polysaccharide monooxygenase 9 n=1 Tax=Rhizophlyctis rosea TaxID=64517 RepID=A0AAD5SKL4_9FUNG|nr:hypothetical protein HK097_011178 [Rhizophlyctis rosea]
MKSFAAALLLPTLVSAHMRIGLPSTWGGNDWSLETPLNSGTSNWFCAGRGRSNAAPTELKAGGTLSVPVICGEASDQPDNGVSICSGDTAAFHKGGGCGIAISYKDPKVIGDFHLISVNHNCPDRGARVNFELPSNLPNGDAVCSWTWVPNPEGSADEMYMNCFNCKVTGGTSGTITKAATPLYWGVPGAPGGYNRPQYNKNFPNGRQHIEVSGGSAPRPTTTYKAPSTTKAPAHTTTYKAPNKTTSTVKVVTTHVGGKKIIRIIRIIRVVRIVKPKA